MRIVERDVQSAGLEAELAFPGRGEPRQRSTPRSRCCAARSFRSFAALGLGLILLAALQALYGLWPLRRVRRAIAAIRSGTKSRIDERFPAEIEPLTEELNELLEHVEVQAEEARRHAGNLAHALKTPLTVITNAATARAPDLADTVCREATTMRRQVDHHLARARAIGRRSSAQARVGGLAVAGSGRARGQPPLTSTSPSTSPATARRRSGSSGRISTRCSAI